MERSLLIGCKKINLHKIENPYLCQTIKDCFHLVLGFGRSPVKFERLFVLTCLISIVYQLSELFEK